MCISNTSYVLYYRPFGKKVHRIFYNFCLIFNSPSDFSAVSVHILQVLLLPVLVLLLDSLFRFFFSISLRLSLIFSPYNAYYSLFFSLFYLNIYFSLDFIPFWMYIYVYYYNNYASKHCLYSVWILSSGQIAGPAYGKNMQDV